MQSMGDNPLRSMKKFNKWLMPSTASALRATIFALSTTLGYATVTGTPIPWSPSAPSCGSPFYGEPSQRPLTQWPETPVRAALGTLFSPRPSGGKYKRSAKSQTSFTTTWSGSSKSTPIAWLRFICCATFSSLQLWVSKELLAASLLDPLQLQDIAEKLQISDLGAIPELHEMFRYVLDFLRPSPALRHPGTCCMGNTAQPLYNYASVWGSANSVPSYYAAGEPPHPARTPGPQPNPASRPA